MNDPPEPDAGWREYQPPWSSVLCWGGGIAGIAALVSYFTTDNLGVIGPALIGFVLVCVYLRWLAPMMEHLKKPFNE